MASGGGTKFLTNKKRDDGVQGAEKKDRKSEHYLLVTGIANSDIRAADLKAFLEKFGTIGHVRIMERTNTSNQVKFIERYAHVIVPTLEGLNKLIKATCGKVLNKCQLRVEKAPDTGPYSMEYVDRNANKLETRLNAKKNLENDESDNDESDNEKTSRNNPGPITKRDSKGVSKSTKTTRANSDNSIGYHKRSRSPNRKSTKIDKTSQRRRTREKSMSPDAARNNSHDCSSANSSREAKRVRRNSQDRPRGNGKFQIKAAACRDGERRGSYEDGNSGTRKKGKKNDWITSELEHLINEREKLRKEKQFLENQKKQLMRHERQRAETSNDLINDARRETSQSTTSISISKPMVGRGWNSESQASKPVDDSVSPSSRSKWQDSNSAIPNPLEYQTPSCVKSATASTGIHEEYQRFTTGRCEHLDSDKRPVGIGRSDPVSLGDNSRSSANPIPSNIPSSTMQSQTYSNPQHGLPLSAAPGSCGTSSLSMLSTYHDAATNPSQRSGIYYSYSDFKRN